MEQDIDDIDAPESTFQDVVPGPVPLESFPSEPASLPFVPDSIGEATRKSGLAWSAGIVFFSSIAFMLGLGWLADLLLGSSPWGLVVGIVIGSLIGFLQFFRITSQIFAQPNSETPPRTLIPEQPDDRHDRFSA